MPRSGGNGGSPQRSFARVDSTCVIADPLIWVGFLNSPDVFRSRDRTTVAVGALAVGRLAVGQARIRRVEIDELVVRRLRITEELQVPHNPDSKGLGDRARE